MQPKQVMRHLLLCLVICALWAGGIQAHAADTDDQVVLLLKWKHQFQFAGVYAAQERGYFAEEGLRVAIREHFEGQNELEEIVAGRVQYGISDGGLLIDYLHGAPVVLLAQIMQVSPLVIYTARDSNILTPKDLKNKTLMLSGGVGGNAPIYALIHKHLGKRHGLNIIPHTFRSDELISGKVDAMTGYLTNLPFTFRKQGFHYNIIDPQQYGVDFYGDNLYTTQRELEQHPQRVASMRRAILRGWAYAFEHPQELIRLIVDEYRSELDAEELDFEANMMKRLIMPELVPLGEVNTVRYQRMAELFKGLGLVDSVEIKQDFFYREPTTETADQLQPVANGILALSDVEAAWLQEHPVIRVAADPAWAPIEYVEDGAFKGLSIDFLKQIEGMLPCRFEIIDDKDWQELVRMGKAQEVDLFSCVMPNPERREYLTFSDTYSSFPCHVFTRSDAAFVSNLEQLQGKTVGVTKHYASHDWLLREYPHLNIKPAPNIETGLDDLINGKTDVFIGNLLTVTYYIGKKRLTNVKVAGETNFRYDVSIGVRRDWPVLRSIMNKAILAIPEQERARLESNWLPVLFEHERDYTIIWRIIIIAAISIILFIFWNRHLAAMVQRRTEALRGANETLAEEVSERSKAEADVRQLNTRLEAVVAALPSALITVNKSGVVQHANPRAIKHYQLEPGAHVLDTLRARHPDLERHLADAIASQCPYFGERVNVSQDTEERWEILHVYPLSGNDGAVVRIDDLTEQVQLEAELLQSRKLESVGQLASGVAHDFNNILQIITSAAHILKPALKDVKDLDRIINHIISASGRGSELTARLLAFARRQIGQVQLVNVNDILNEVANLCRHTFDKLINISVSVRAENCHAQVDAGELHSALVNLSVNARDAMPNGGVLELQTSVVDDRWIEIVVRDNGAGIPEPLQANIFEPFFTTKESGKGTGLGLPGVKRSIEEAGGTLQLESEEGVGSTFTIRLPLVQDEGTTDEADDQELEEKAAAKGACILLVEDEVIIREITAEVLRTADYEVIEKEDGLMGLEWYQAHYREVDLLIIDMVMPRMGGADAIKRMHKINPALQAIITSGYIPDEDLEQIPDGVVIDIIAKPTSPNMLLDAVRDALSE